MTGHSVQRCYKLGYTPPHYDKGKRVAATVKHDEDELDGNTTQPDLPITNEQYQKLMAMLYKHNSSGHAASSSHAKSACVAGKLCFLTSTHTPWVFDSGATDHICYDLSLFATYAHTSTDNTITVPDGSKVPVTYVGVVHLNDNIVLKWSFICA